MYTAIKTAVYQFASSQEVLEEEKEILLYIQTNIIVVYITLINLFLRIFKIQINSTY